MYSVLSVTTNIGGFKKTTYPEAGLITYDGNNYSIRIKTVGVNSYIEFLDNDQSTFDAQLTQKERLQKIIDFTNLTDKRGQLTAEAYVEDIISTDATPQTTPVTGGGTGGGDVTVIGNDTDFSTETTLASVLAKITSDPSTATNQGIANAILSAWATQGVPLKSQQGIAFGVSSKQSNVLSGISTGDDECAYLFRSIVGSGGVALRSFFLSFESTTNDEYEIRFSVNPTFSNHTFVDGNFSQDPIIGPTNPVQSKLEVAVAGQLGVPSGPLIDGYDEANGGRFLLGKRAMGNQTVDSRLLFELFIPEGALFAISILASTNGAAVKASANWNE